MEVFFYVVIGAIAVLTLVHYIISKIWPLKTFIYRAEQMLKEKDPQMHELFNKISKESGFSIEALLYTHYALVLNKENGINTPDRTCEIFLELFETLYKENPKGIAIVGIDSSKDLGKIAFELQKRGVVEIPEKVKLSDFDDQFETPER